MSKMESQKIEHKKSFSKGVIISLVAFANTNGGKVIVGVDKNGDVCGVNIAPETIQQYLNEIKVATYPQLFPKIMVEEKDGKKIIIFAISEFPVKPVGYKNRYYKNFSDIVIKIFDDRIIFTNPGILYGKLSISDLECDDYVSSIRNRLLAESFYLTGDIERYGTGFVRIREFLQDYPELSFSFRESGDFFMTELRVIAPPTTPPITPPITEFELKFLGLIKSSPKSSFTELSETLQMSRDTVKEYIDRLKKKGVLKRKGTPHTGYWIITNSEENHE